MDRNIGTVPGNGCNESGSSSRPNGYVASTVRNIIAVAGVAALTAFSGACSESTPDGADSADPTKTLCVDQEPESKIEKMQPEKPFGGVLRFSKRIDNSDTQTWQDNILDSTAVTKHFLGNKFNFSLAENGKYNDKDTRLYHFTLFGEKSGYTLKGTKSATLADAVNILLETSGEATLRSWIVWLYQKSFGVTLEPQRLKFVMNGGKLEDILYDPPGNFNRLIKIQVIQKMDEVLVAQPGGHNSKDTENQMILDDKNHLILPSGVSPYHDVVVPSELLKADPHFNMDLKSYGVLPDITASSLLGKINDFNQRKKEHTARTRHVRIDEWGRSFSVEQVAQLIERNDPLMKTLATYITKDIPKAAHSQRIMAIIRFVQSYSYKWEYDTNFDRPGLITLFNGGSDCNNLSDLFVQLMLAEGYDAAVFHVAFKNDENLYHLKGGIPAEYFPTAAAYTFGKNKYVPIELTSKNFNPGVLAFGDEKTSLIEEFRVNDVAEPPPKVEVAKNDYETLKTQAWVWVGKSIQTDNDMEKRDKIIAYLELLDAAQSGELYTLDIVALKRKWPGGEWDQGFSRKNKDKDVAAIAESLRKLVSQPHAHVAVQPPKVGKNTKIIAYWELLGAVQSGELYRLKSIDDLKKKWPGGEWNQGFHEKHKDHDLATIVVKLKMEVNTLEKKYFSNSKKNKIIAYLELLDAVQSGELYRLKSIDDLKKKWPGGEWNQGFLEKHKDTDVATITEKIRELLSVPRHLAAQVATGKNNYEELRVKAWVWLGQNGRGGKSENKARIVAYLGLLDSIQSGELYRLEGAELKQKWPGGEWDHGFSIDHQNKDAELVVKKLEALL